MSANALAERIDRHAAGGSPKTFTAENAENAERRERMRRKDRRSE